MSSGVSSPTALVALGKNWELPIPTNPSQIKPSFDTRLTATAAGILFAGGAFDALILSTGHTAGPNYPSEAQALRSVLRERFDETTVPDEAIIMDELSFDTSGNLRCVDEICRKHGIGAVALLTVNQHTPRARRLSRVQLGVPVVGVYRSNDVVQQHDNLPQHFYAKSVARQTVQNRSPRPLLRVVSSYALEAAAWSLLPIDPTGEGISRAVTSKLRHQ